MRLSPPVRSLLIEAASRAAAAASRLSGCGDKNAVDQAAVEAIVETLEKSPAAFRVVSCEGEKDRAPRIAHGAVLGKGRVRYELALDPVDGTTVVAEGRGRASVVLAVTTPGGFRATPECRFEHLLLPEIPSKPGTLLILERERNLPVAASWNRAGWRLRWEPGSELAAALDVISSRRKNLALAGIGGGPETLLMAALAEERGAFFLARPAPGNPLENDRLSRSAFREGEDYGASGFLRAPVTVLARLFDCGSPPRGKARP